MTATFTWDLPMDSTAAAIARQHVRDAASTTNDVIDADMRVRVAGAVLIIYSMGAIIGPLIVGLLTDILGNQALFLFSFAASSSLAAFAIYRRIYQAIFVKPVQPFVPVPSQQMPSDELYLATQDDQEILPGATTEDNEGVLEQTNK